MSATTKMCRGKAAACLLLWCGQGLCGAQRLAAAEPPASAPPAKMTVAELSRFIDGQIDRRLAEAKSAASPAADDAEFLRRVYVDLHGIIPPADQVAAFLDSKDPDKRAKVIDELLASPRYGQYQSDTWTRVLYRVILERRYSPPSDPLTRWLEESFNNNLPWDRLSHQLITASGPVYQNGTVAYLVHTKGVRPIEEITNLTVRIFLGRSDMKCAQCHNHPFIKLKQDDYWGMAAFFAQMTVSRAGPGLAPYQNGNLGIADKLDAAPSKDAMVTDGFKVVAPKFLQGEQPKLDASVPYRKVFADWATSPRNPFFAKAMVNRTWAQLFGRGLVHPIDEMNEDHPPSHPELLAGLAEQFAANGFNVKDLLRAICNSRTYQRSSRTLPGNAEDSELYSHMPIKVLSPMQLFDSLERLAPLSEAARKQGRKSFIDSFGMLDSTDGEQPDFSEYNRNMAQQLRLMTANPPFQTLVANLVKQSGQQAVPQRIEQLYLHILSRRPSGRELEQAVAFVRERGEPGLVELGRVLLNTSEFALNH